jgi:hypothetical protein
MKSRREFIQLSSMGFLSPAISSLAPGGLKESENKKGVVYQPEEGETYFHSK